MKDDEGQQNRHGHTVKPDFLKNDSAKKSIIISGNADHCSDQIKHQNQQIAEICIITEKIFARFSGNPTGMHEHSEAPDKDNQNFEYDLKYHLISPSYSD